MRLDSYLVGEKHFPSREKASFAIKNGQVFVNGLCVKKASYIIDGSKDELVVQTDEVLPYVSVGGLKLEKAIRHFQLDFINAKVLDIGSSTGGFTDCALQHGAAHVTAVDVGTNQLDSSLRKHAKITLFEKMDFRDLAKSTSLSPDLDFVLSDLSFISMRKLMPFLPDFMNEKSFFIGLIKPQFEVGKDAIGRDGIVKNPEHHFKIMEEIIKEAKNFNFNLHNLVSAPIHDKKKNIEYLALFSQQTSPRSVSVKSVVYEAIKQKSNL